MGICELQIDQRCNQIRWRVDLINGLENAAVGHSDVAEAAAIGVPHPKWDERPVLVIVTNDGKDADKQSIISQYQRG